MKPDSYKRSGQVILAVVVIIAVIWYVNVSSQKKGEKNENVGPDTEVKRRWIELEMVDIPISPDSEGKADLTRNFYFVLDGSGSMRRQTTGDCGGDREFPTKIVGARWAVKKFLEHVPTDVSLGLYVFDNNGRRESVPLGSSNRQAFINAVDDIDAGGGTPLAESIRFGTDKLVARYKQQFGYGEFRLVVVTDGEADFIPEAAVYAARRGIPIYTIGLCVGPDHPLRYYSVSYRAADNFADLARGLQETLAELPGFDVTQFE